ncbi:prepilin-type N-terminal cleavage/methylation domain-containing protein [bacterium]|nr:prepilin-type N-terminal cleavage/methylation domain-containing protein [bacterium]
MNKILEKIRKQQAGVTLLELVVAISLFTMLILSVTQIFNMTLRVGANVVASQKVQKEMRYIFEVISKEVRMAKVDKSGICIAPDWLFVISGGGQELSFLNKDDECVVYSFVDDSFSIDRDGVSEELTSDEIVVEDLEFRRFGYTPAEQPAILLRMTVYNKNDSNKKINLQTTISSRDYE